MPVGSTVAFTPRRIATPTGPISRASQAHVVGADGVVVGDRARPPRHRVGRRGLGREPARQRVVALLRRDGEVERAARSRRRGTRGRARACPRPRLASSAAFTSAYSRSVLGPEGRRLQRLDQDADVEHRVAEVRRVEPPLEPRLAALLAQRLAAEVGQHRGDRGARRAAIDVALVADDHQAARRALAADVGLAGQVERRLGLVGEPDDRGQQLVLREVAHRGLTGGEGLEAPRLVGRLGRRPRGPARSPR